MSERGVFAVDRGIWDHPVFADEPLTEREAWQWLISEASFRERARNISGRIVALKRGQLAASIRFMAERWKWSKSAVDRFLDKLRAETMIGTDSGTGILVITVNNYDKFQRVSLPDGTDIGTQNGTAAGQQRDKREDTEYIETKDIPSDDWPEDFRERFWAEVPRKVGKQGAIRVLERVRKRGVVSWVKLISAIKAYAATADPAFTKHPETWLSKGCWDDELQKKPETAVTDWDQILSFYKKTNIWSRHVGPEPGMSGCRAPPELLQKHGIAA